MPLNGDLLGQQMASAVSGVEDPNDAWKAIGNAIVDHIKANGQVMAGIPVSTTGSAAAQTGSTTGPGTIS